MHEIRIPRLGWSMEEGVFVGWLKKSGDAVAVGDPLFELEGEKAAQEIESVDAGVLHIVPNGPSSGDEVKVGALLGYLLAPGEVAPSGDGEQPVVSTSTPKAAACVANPTDASVAVCAESGPVSTPRARRVAAEVGVDWTTLQGTGRDGRIREADVRAAAAEQGGAATTSGRSTVLGLSPRRKAIADRLRVSRERTIPVTLTSSCNANNLVALREQFKVTKSPLVPALTDIVAYLVAHVLKQHPQLSARWQDDGSSRSLVAVSADQIAVGIAVDTPDGLLVPVVAGVARKSLLDVTAETKSLIEKARSGRLTAAEMQGAVISISNLGAYGIDGFTPVINYPEIAILGLGAVRREAVVLADDRVVAQSRMTLSLTFDHVALDGAPAAAFLQAVVSAIENPAAILLGNGR